MQEQVKTRFAGMESLVKGRYSAADHAGTGKNKVCRNGKFG
jgi:hypothetical protein